MRQKELIFAMLLMAFFLQSCGIFDSTFDKQVKACIADVKLGLGDPGSLEVVSSEGTPLDNGWYRINLKFTAKNALGGRVRGQSLCGFKSKDIAVLNSDDFVNQTRKLARDLKDLGIK